MQAFLRKPVVPQRAGGDVGAEASPPHPSTLEKFAVRFGAERLALLVAATCAKLAMGMRPALFVADRGYDSERNREIMEERLGMRAVIPLVRQLEGSRRSRWRRHRAEWEIANDSGWQEAYGKRQSSEAVNHMVRSTKGVGARGKTEATR